MNKKLVVLTAAFALFAGFVFAEEMKADAPAAAPAMNAAAENADMNAEAANAEDMNAEAANAEDMNAEGTKEEEMKDEGAKEEGMNAEAPAAAPAAGSKY